MATLSLRVPLWVSKILLPSRDSISCHSFIFSLHFFALSVFSLALRASSSWLLPVYLSLAFSLSLQPYVFPCRPLPGHFSPLRLPLSRRRCLMMGYQILFMFLVSSFIKVVSASEICSWWAVIQHLTPVVCSTYQLELRSWIWIASIFVWMLDQCQSSIGSTNELRSSVWGIPRTS